MNTADPSQEMSPVDIVVATRNSERFLQQCLESIIAQGIPEIQITIVDQQSTDRTRSIAAQVESAVVVDQSGQGLAQAWNQGLRAGSRPVVAMIDSDDYWAPGYLSAAVRALQERPDAQCAMAQARFELASPDVPPGFRANLVDSEQIGWMPGTTVFRRTIFDHLGYFPEELQIASDIEWFARLRQTGLPIVQLPMVGLHKRIHGGNLSLNGFAPSTYHSEILQVARRRLKAST